MSAAFSLFINLFLCSTALEYYISASNGTSCPNDVDRPCHSLSFYCSNSSLYFTNNSIFYFLEGNHKLLHPLMIENVNNLTLQGKGHIEQGFHETVMQSTSIIRCISPITSVDATGGLFITKSYNIILRNITITNCSNNQDQSSLIFSTVFNAILNGVLIQPLSGTGLTMYNCLNCSIVDSTFASIRAMDGQIFPYPHQNVNVTFTDIEPILNAIPHDESQWFELTILRSNFLFSYFTDSYPNHAIGLSIALRNKIAGYGYKIQLLSSLFYGSNGPRATNLLIHITQDSAKYNIFIDSCVSSYSYSMPSTRQYSIEPYGHAMTFWDSSAQRNHPTRLIIHNSNFTDNIGNLFSGVLIQYQNESSTNITLDIISCIISRNKGAIGAGLYISFPDNIVDSYSFVVLRQIVVENNEVRISNTINSITSINYGAISLYNTNVRMNDVIIQHNLLTGILGISINLIFSFKNYILNNTGIMGGGMALQSSLLILDPIGIVYLINNHAEEIGGGIYIKSGVSSIDPFSSPHCFFQILESQTGQVILSNNTAKIAGSAMFVPVAIDEQCNQNIDEVFDIQQEGNSVLSSEPISIFFCSNKSLTKRWWSSVIPGQDIITSIVATGLRNGYTPAVVGISANQPFVHNKTVPLKAECTEVSFTLFIQSNVTSALIAFTLNSIGNSEVLNYTDIDDKYGTVAVEHVTSLPCPPGFELNQGICTCVSLLINDNIKCDIKAQQISRQGNLWIGYDEKVNCTALYESCPFNYCTKNNISFTITSPDPQCALNRSGLLCGQCAEGLSLMLGSNQCGQCTNNYLALIIPFALVGIALVAFLIALNLTVSVGTINGLIFYANVVKLYEPTFFPNDQPSILTSILKVYKYVISWLNLDLGIETCLYNGMDTYSKTWLQFVFPFYVWSIIILVIYTCRRSSYASRLMGFNAVPVLATLLLLSYMKLLRSIVSVLHLTELSYSSCDEEKTVILWYLDGNVQYTSFKHLILLGFAVFILLFLWAPYTFLLLISPLIERYFSGYKLFKNWYKLKPLFDAYSGPYKDKYRFWTGALLLARFILLLAISFSDSKVTLPILGTTISVLYALNVSFRGVYRHSQFNLLESWFYFNLIFVTVMSSHSNAQTSLGMVISLSLVHLTVVAIVILHIQMKVRNSRWWPNKLDNKQKTTKKLLKKNDKHADSGDLPIVTTSVSILDFELEREPLIFDDDNDQLEEESDSEDETLLTSRT